MDMGSYSAVQKPFLSKTNISERIVWAEEDRYWNMDQWTNVAFTDEATLTVRLQKSASKVGGIGKENCI